MAISRTTRTHLIYQFIILTLLFLGIGYNELLPDRKFVLFITFVPMFLYQMLILSCCMELLPIPSWMNFCCETKKMEMRTEKTETDSLPRSPATESKPPLSNGIITKTPLGNFPDISERIQEPRRWEKSTVNIGATPKQLTSHAQKSKSWMNLSELTRSMKEISLSREGSLDVLAPKTEKKMRSTSKLSKAKKANYREERASKARSWRPNLFSADSEMATHPLTTESKFTQPSENSIKEALTKPPFSRIAAMQQEESSELSKSYSFPFRQKRLETWLEMKETETRESNQSLDMPYWQTVGYNLAVKYEARRRRRVTSSPTKLDTSTSVESQLHTSFFQKSIEIQKDQKSNQKKTSKLASNYISKIKTSISNILSKKKEEETTVISNKALKPSLSFRSKNKNILCQPKKEEKATVPGGPQYLSNDRPLIFYPKYIPFEKERFESDVQKKMVELSEEHTGLHRMNTK